MWKKNLLLFFGLLIGGGCAFLEAPPDGDLVIDIDSNYRIVLPDRFASREDEQAFRGTAEMLQQALEAAVGWKFPVVSSYVAERAPGRSLCLGNCEYLRRSGIDPERLGRYDYLLVNDGDDIHIGGKGYEGTVKGATVFAENFLGVRFLYPGEVGTEYASRPGKVVIPRPLKLRGKAPSVFRSPDVRGFFYKYACNCFGGVPATVESYGEALRRLDSGGDAVVFRTDRDWRSILTFARRLEKDRPGKKLLLPAEGNTARPPAGAQEFPDNVIVCFKGEIPSAWRQVKLPGGFALDIDLWGVRNPLGFTAKRTPGGVAEALRRSREPGISGINRYEFGENFGMEAPVYYLFGKLLETPDRNPDEIFHDFCRFAFRESAAPMEQFYRTLYERLELFSRLEEMQAVPKDSKILLGMIYSPELLSAMENHLTRAETLARKVNVKKRLMLVRMEFDYVKTTGRCIAFYQVWKLASNPANFRQFSGEAGVRDRMVETLAERPDGQLPNWPEMPAFGGKQLKESLPSSGGSALAFPPPHP